MIFVYKYITYVLAWCVEFHEILKPGNMPEKCMMRTWAGLVYNLNFLLNNQKRPKYSEIHHKSDWDQTWFIKKNSNPWQKY